MFDEPQKKKEEKQREERKGERGGQMIGFYTRLCFLPGLLPPVTTTTDYY